MSFFLENQELMTMFFASASRFCHQLAAEALQATSQEPDRPGEPVAAKHPGVWVGR